MVFMEKLNKRGFIFISVFFILIAMCPGKNYSDNPMKPTPKAIQNGEVLRYSVMEKGTKTGDFTIVNTVDDNSKKITAYMTLVKIGSKVKIPDHYTNYPSKMIVSLESGSLQYFFEDYQTNAVLDNKKGIVFTELKIDEKSLEANYIEKDWDGCTLKTSSSTLKIKPGYPVWNWNSVMYLGLRYLDPSNPGSVNMVVPHWIKDPFVGSFIFKGREIVETKAGKFNTVKFSWSMGNIFLAMLMEIFYKDYFFWIDEETGILVKETGDNNNSCELDEISVWK